MRLTVNLVLYLLVLLFVILNAMGKCPAWTWGLCLVLEGLIRLVPQ